MSQRIIPIDGVFDTKAAIELRRKLAVTAPSGPVTLDFHRARDIHDIALADIARGLVSDGITARYCGLMHHQERMLHYLGFEASA